MFIMLRSSTISECMEDHSKLKSLTDEMLNELVVYFDNAKEPELIELLKAVKIERSSRW